MFPPIACRLLAKHHYGHPLTSEEISHASGLTVGTVEYLSEQTSWDNVPVSWLQKFTAACRVDFFDSMAMERVKHYLAGRMKDGVRQPPKFGYLRRDPRWKTYYRPLLMRWRESLKMP